MNTQANRTKRKTNGFTLVELLGVIGIIGILMSILVPTVRIAVIQSKNATMKATIHAISLGLDQFRNDFGSYPESDFTALSAIDSNLPYRGSNLAPHNGPFMNTGAHLLTEAMLGEDNLGYEVNHRYYITNGYPVDGEGSTTQVKRWGPYVSIENLKVDNLPKYVETIEDTYRNSMDERVWENNMNSVIFDSFNTKNPRPIVSFKANIRGRSITGYDNGIYNFGHNSRILEPFGMESTLDINQYPNVSDQAGSPREWTAPSGATRSLLQCFPYYIWDHKSEGMTPWLQNQWAARPYNADSFILMSAGYDGIYGTDDDICNFDLKK